MMRCIILALLLVGCGDTPDKDSPNDTPNNGTSNTPNNGTSNTPNNGTSNTPNNGTSNTPNNTDGGCAVDTDCSLGQVCRVDDMTCIVAACEFCTADQVCYKPTPDAAGSCSAPECATDDDCGPEFCSQGVCSEDPICTSNEDCEDGEICNIAGECVTE